MALFIYNLKNRGANVSQYAILICCLFIPLTLYPIAHSVTNYSIHGDGTFSPEIWAALDSGTVGSSDISVNGTTANVTLIPARYHYVNTLSDIDGIADVGNHSNFTAQQTGPDLLNDTLSEQVTGFSNTSLINAESFEGTWPPIGWSATDRWNQESDQVYDGTYSADYDGRGGGSSGNLDSPSLNCSGASAVYVDFWYRVSLHTEFTPDDFLLQYYNGSSWNTIIDLGATSTENQWHHYQETIADTQYLIVDFQARWAATTINNGETVYVDYVTVTKEVGSGNYALDLEVQWNNVSFGELNEELCIFGGEMDAENLTVAVWNGTEWTQLLSNVSPGWNNISITTYLTSSNFTIRFQSINNTGDEIQDNWDIDTSLLHVWTGVDHTFDYVLKAVSQKTATQTLRMSVSTSTNIDILRNCTIWLRDAADISVQIRIIDGVVVTSNGSWFTLMGFSERYIVAYVDETLTGVAELSLKLEVRDDNSIIYDCVIRLIID